MTDPTVRMAELSMQGFGCSQILMILALEAEGKRDPDLVRAVSALQGGLAFSGKLCGALSGGACALALHGGRGSPEEVEDPRVASRIRRLVAWFEAEYGERDGGIDCATLLGGDPGRQLTRCPGIVLAVAEQVRALLADDGEGA
jgi:hypothetical protein